MLLVITMALLALAASIVISSVCTLSYFTLYIIWSTLTGFLVGIGGKIYVKARKFKSEKTCSSVL